MPTVDPRVDAYIEEAQPFARPILRHIRALVHEACPEVVETMKWGFPHFDSAGLICSMAAFTQHCALTFWNGAEVVGEASKDGAMGQFGRIRSRDDLPDDGLVRGYVRKAAALRLEGAPRKRAPRKTRPEPDPPEDLLRELERDPVARRTWEGFSPSHRREYIEWIDEAKREATRERRLAQTMEWLAEGKPRNWKYL